MCVPPSIINLFSLVTTVEWFIIPNGIAGTAGSLNLELPITSILFEIWNGHPPIAKIHFEIDNRTVMKSEVAYELLLILVFESEGTFGF